MTADELAQYHVDCGKDGDFCWLCLDAIAPGSECLLVPKDCDDTAKMDAGKPYACFKAHRTCLERVP